MKEITIYTSGGAVSYQIKETTEDFKSDFMKAIENGIVTVETAEGSFLIVNPMNCAAIEIRNDAISEKDPPGSVF